MVYKSCIYTLLTTVIVVLIVVVLVVFVVFVALLVIVDRLYLVLVNKYKSDAPEGFWVSLGVGWWSWVEFAQPFSCPTLLQC